MAGSRRSDFIFQHVSSYYYSLYFFKFLCHQTFEIIVIVIWTQMYALNPFIECFLLSKEFMQLDTTILSCFDRSDSV